MSFFFANNITAGYGKKPIVESVSFALNRGEILGILGANGSGKTTLLKAVCGILPHKGTATLDNIVLEDCSPKQIAKCCSYIPQRSGISIDISSLDVVLMGFNPQLGLLDHPNKAMIEQAKQALVQVGLGDKIEQNYLHLSEGQKQLCILARTLVASAKLLLLDEPESALDFRYRHQMLRTLRGWVKTNKSGAIVTLHDPSLALNACDALLLLADGAVLGTLHPATDSLEQMEHLLRQIYGNISLQYVTDQSGRRQLILLYEDTI